MIDGKKTLKELINSSSPNSFQVVKTLYVLCSTGILEEKEDEAEKANDAVSLEDILKAFHEEGETLLKKVDGVYSNLTMLSAGELLEIDESSDTEAVKNNYYKLVKEFHPDRYLTVADPSIKDKVIAILEAITKAYSFLKEDDKRKDYFSKQRLIARLNSFRDALKKRRDVFFESLERA
jgi:DnaJ-domain-containing protein 1